MDIRENTTKVEGFGGTASARVEVLAPAGSFETLQAVIEAGADAVYIGGRRFGARAYADNPAEDELLQAIDYAHLRGVKVYMTVNTLLTDREMDELFDYLNPYYEAGLDACIVQDLGVLSFLRSHFPLMPIHLSTQMTVTNAQAEELFDEGVTRIVPARELSLAEIRAMKNATKRELEIFVHGALCYCYSGQCLMSSLIGGRSGNRGRCAQPCRKEYQYTEGGKSAKGYLLSPKDQCLLPRLHELLETGIHSLKIEGRMKRLEYAAGVTSIYRKWVDRFYELGSSAYRQYLEKHPGEMEQDIRTLAELFNRGGFCEGYVFDSKGPDMMCTKRPNHTGVRVGTAKVFRKGSKLYAEPVFTEKIGTGEVLELRTTDEKITCGEWTTPAKSLEGESAFKIPAIPILWKKEYGALPEKLNLNIWRMKKAPLSDGLAERYGRQRKPISVKGMFTAEAGNAMSLTVQSADEGRCVQVSGPIPEPAKNAAATVESVRDRLMKTGGTAYAFSDLSIFLSDGLFIPVSVLNDLRREALEQYTKECLKEFHREGGLRNTNREPMESATEEVASRVIASVMTSEQMNVVRNSQLVTDIYIDMDGDYEECLQCKTEKPVFLMLPRALKGTVRDRVCAEAKRIYEDGLLSGIVVRTVDQLAFFRNRGILIESDKTLYCMNSTSVEQLQENGIRTVTFSEELRKDELPNAAGSVLTVYGRSVAMVSEQCPRRTLGICGSGNAEGKAGRNVTGLLTDGEREHFPTKSVCKYCHSLIYNSHIMSLLSVMHEVPIARLSGIRTDFTLESGEETEAVLQKLSDALDGQVVKTDGTTTQGHWNRGVE